MGYINRIIIILGLNLCSLISIGQYLKPCEMPIGVVADLVIVDAAFEEEAFVIMPIDSVVLTRMKGKSYKSDCTLDIDDLRYLRVLHRNLEGEICVGELVCHRDIAVDLIEIFKSLYESSYPIEKMTLIDEYDADDTASMEDNNTSCFNFRFVGGTRKLSNHSMGKAIDINPLYNPYVKVKNGEVYCSPKESTPYVDRIKKYPYKISCEDQCYKEFIKRGFKWGGDWKSVKDYQHFEKP